MIEVDTGEVKSGTGNVILNSNAIGSCVVIIACDPIRKIGALAHVMLPGKARSNDDPQRTRYAANAIETLSSELAHLGTSWNDVEVYLAGGGNPLKRDDDTVGRDNIASVSDLLRKQGARIKAESLGGTNTRHVMLDVERGVVTCMENNKDVNITWIAGTTDGTDTKRHERVPWPPDQESGERENEAACAVSTDTVGPAILNIMRDMEANKTELERSQKALLNIMKDMETSRSEVENSQKASLNMMQDMAAQRIELAEAKAYVENIVKSMIDSLIVVDPEGRIKTINTATSHLLGYTEDELLGQPVALIMTEDMPLLEKDEKAVSKLDMVYRAKNGEKIPVSISISVIKDGNGRTTEVVCIAEDMRNSRLLRELEKSNRELKETTAQIIQSEKLSALGQLAAGVAHELNQPLNVIKIIGQSVLRDIAKDRYPNENMKTDMPDIINQVNKMTGIIDHMRIFSRRAEGTGKAALDINTVVGNALKFMEQQLKNHDVRLVKKIDLDLPAVMCDPIQVEQVLVNLVVNARLALEDCKKADKIIEIRTYKVDNLNSVAIDVSDNANGIPEGIKEKIFEPFFTTRPPGKGTGLGLSVSKKIIDEHGGTLSVRSEIGIGSNFTFTLPLC